MLPGFSHFYGIHPWDFDRMSYVEISEYIKQYDAYMKQANKQK